MGDESFCTATGYSTLELHNMYARTKGSILKKQDVKKRTGFIWLSTEISDGLL
jgi:hypothetical protein